MNTEWILFKKTATRPPSQNSSFFPSRRAAQGWPQRMLGKTQPPGSGLSQADHPEPPEAVPGKTARAWSVWADSEEGPPRNPRHMQPPGAWLSRKCLCWEEKGPLSPERSSPARTQGSVSGGLLHWACLYKADFSALHDNPGAAPLPSLQSTPYL